MFIVQQSFPTPRPSTNPYLIMLAESIDSLPGVELRTFSWSRVLLGRYSVLHVHWPEILLQGQTPVKSAVRTMLTALLMVKLAVLGIPLVRTQHNLSIPADVVGVRRWMLEKLEKQTTLWIRLNDETPAQEGREYELIPHGHYRDWFARYEWPESIPGRVSYFGLIRPYKGVDTLLKAFGEVAGDVSLRAAGKPRSQELAGDLEELAAMDERIQLDLHFLTEEEIVDVVRGAELVVLPYREMHNSGGVLTTLSLDRPVLVPANPVNARLSEEVGPGWVYQYEGDLTGADIKRTLDSVTANREHGNPDLSGRNWSEAGLLHYAAYLRAVNLLAVRRGDRRRRRPS